MSEEKLYAVKNDDGEWSDDSGAFYPEKKNGTGFIFTMFSDRDEATGWAERNTNGGHVVTLIEEPKKVVLIKEEAEIVEYAHYAKCPASYISDHTGSSYGENQLINAYVNGYTVAKEKKYLVYRVLGGKQKHEQFAQAYRSSVYPGTVSWILTNEVTNGSFAQFTEAEIENYGLQDCEKVWCDSVD